MSFHNIFSVTLKWSFFFSSASLVIDNSGLVLYSSISKWRVRVSFPTVANSSTRNTAIGCLKRRKVAIGYLKKRKVAIGCPICIVHNLHIITSASEVMWQRFSVWEQTTRNVVSEFEILMKKGQGADDWILAMFCIPSEGLSEISNLVS